MSERSERRGFWEIYRSERRRGGQSPLGWGRAILAVALALAVGFVAVRAGGWSILLGLAFLALAALLIWLLATRRW